MTAKNSIASLALLASTLALPLKAETITYHFDSPEEILQFNPKFKDPSALLETAKTAAGAGALKTTAGFQTSAPKDWNAGVLSFWAYDDYSDIVDTWKWHNIEFNLVKTVDGKQQTFLCQLRRFSFGWKAKLKDPSQDYQFFTLPDAPNHGGWTRFDIVGPNGAGPKQFTIFIDGYKVFTTPDKYDAVASVSTAFMPYVDEFSFNPDPASFRPNPVRGILPDNPYGQLLLQPGEKLRVPIALDPTGARAKSGELELRLLDGRGKVLVSEKSTINWGKSDNFAIELPSPPRSGNFWLEAKYQEAGVPAEVTRRKAIVQFLAPGFAAATQAPLELFRRTWDFLPVGKNEPDLAKVGASNPTKEELTAPAAAPTDWSKAFPLRGTWFFGSFGRNWDTFYFSCHAGWYHQVVDVPKAWKGQKIMLEIDSPESVATVFANGKLAGALEWPGGELDLSAFVAPGKKLDLAIHMAADPLTGYFKLAKKVIGATYQPPSKLQARGLYGDVVLRPVPRTGPEIDEVAVVTSVAKKELAATFELSGLEPGKTYKLKAAATTAGKTAKELPETTFTAKAATEQVKLAAPWADPILWELGAPYLYDLNATLLDAGGKTLASLWPERFGVREVAGTGPDLTLNGRPVTLFLYAGEAEDTPEDSQWCAKFNFNTFREGTGRENARIMDEAGLTADGQRHHWETTLLAPLDMGKSGKENDPEFWAGLTKLLSYQIKSKRNHPSVIFNRGVLAGGMNGNGGMYNPLFQDGVWVNERRGNDVSMRTLKAGRRVIDILHQLDPTRLVNAQDSGSVNDTMQITEYAGFQPIQEFIERSEYWRANGTKPFMISEQAAPMFPNWTDACAQGKGWSGVPCFAEWTAITSGDEAYVRTELDNQYLGKLEKAVAEKRKAAAAGIDNPILKKAAMEKIRMEYDQWFYMYKDEVLHNVLWRDRIREEVFHWRANHLGMLAYFFSGGGPDLESCYQEFQAPVTGFLAGTKDKPTLKNHIFAPGETLERGAILLNNSYKPDSLTCSWKLELGGQTVAEGSKTETVPAGGEVFVPIAAAISAGPDRSGQLSVDFLKDGKKLRSDRCDIDVVAPKSFVNQGRIALVDPEGDSAKALAAAGVKFQRLTFDADFTSFDTVIFGRRAFNYELGMLPEGLDLGELTKQGKRILVMEQDEKTLRERFKLRTEYLSPRDAYGRVGGDPLTADLPDRLLKNWRGTATLTDGYEIARNRGQVISPHEFGNGGTWLYPWNDGELHPRPIKWGNTHNVATVTAIKPDTGNFRTLVDCGQGSNYAAAWELENGKSRIVFNQMDVSGRSEPEPAATRYLQNLVSHVQTAPAPKLLQAAYLGGDTGAALLKQLDVPFRKVATASEADPTKNILVLGDATPEQLTAWKDGLAKFAEAGGTIFSLPRSEADFAAGWTPFAVTAKKRTVNHTVVGKPAAPLLAGLGNSDFYWKGNMDIVSMEKAEGAKLLLDTGVLAEIPHGQGRYVLCQVEPALFGDVELNHWLKPSQRNTERLVRTLLSNAGVAMSSPKLLAQPGARAALDHVTDLGGVWKVRQAKPDESTCPDANAPGWRDMNLPGSPQASYPEWQGVKGSFWFRRELNLDQEPAPEETLHLEIGRISGCDILYVNGGKAAKSDLETDVNSVATIARNYPLPGGLFKKGKNELALRVDYETNHQLGLNGSTGEVAGPLDLKFFKTKDETKLPKSIDLASSYEWKATPVSDPAAPAPKENDTTWKKAKIPGILQTAQPEWSKLSGYFLCQRQFTFDAELPDSAQPTLILGAVDDEDTTYLNGVKIGHTGKDTNPKDYYSALRRYPISKDMLKKGKNANTLQVLVNDFNGSGGISQGPVQILFEAPETTLKRKLAESPYLHSVSREDDPYWHHGF